MTFKSLTKEDIGVTTWNAEKAVLIDHVRSAVEALKEDLMIRFYQFDQMSDSIIKESHMREIAVIQELIDIRFPVFLLSSNDTERLATGIQSSHESVRAQGRGASGESPVLHSHSHSIPIGRQVTSPHSDVVETGPSASLDSVEKMGAATESVANSEGRQQSMATCCRQQSEGSSPSPSNPHSQKHAARKGLGIKCGMGLHKSCQSKIRCGCDCHKKEGDKQ